MYENFTIFFKSIISNGGIQFVNDFWKFLCKKLNINMKLSTVWHFETDDQIERFNEIMKQYFKTYMNYLQNDWPDWLFLVEFADNNTEFEITKMISFFANKKFHFRMNFEFGEFPFNNIKKINVEIFAKKYVINSNKSWISCQQTTWLSFLIQNRKYDLIEHEKFNHKKFNLN